MCVWSLFKREETYKSKRLEVLIYSSLYVIFYLGYLNLYFIGKQKNKGTNRGYYDLIRANRLLITCCFKYNSGYTYKPIYVSSALNLKI